MRDIRFRAWNGKEMHYNTSHLELWKKKQYEIMQYTGLKDKNGKEIYEGDILAYPSQSPKHKGKVFNNVVEFASGQSLCGWRMRNKSCVVKSTPYKFAISEVIGNIHEHSHLLK
jgi:uncharacterized phage protein (TIGR01671 family)